MITRRGPYQCRPEDALGKQRLVSGTMAALLGKQTDFDVSKAARFLAGMHAQYRRSFWNARATYFNGTSCEASFRSPLVPQRSSDVLVDAGTLCFGRAAKYWCFVGLPMSSSL